MLQSTCIPVADVSTMMYRLSLMSLRVIFVLGFALASGMPKLKRETDCSGKFAAVTPSLLKAAVIDGACMYMVDQTYTYNAAKSLCEAEGTHLVHTPDPETQQAIEEAFGVSQFWTGLQKVKGVWQWVGLSGIKEEMTDARWENDFPPSDKYDVVAYSTSGMRGEDRVFYWKGARTNYHYRPVCQSPLPTLADCTISDDCSGKFSTIPVERLQYDFIDGVCVYLIDHPYTYRDANALCKGEGTHLVHVQDPAMQQAIQDSFHRTQFWTGLKKIKGVWKWVGLGGEKEVMDTPRWENGFPPSDSNDVVMYTTQGNDPTGAPTYNWKGARVNYSYRVVCQTPRC